MKYIDLNVGFVLIKMRMCPELLREIKKLNVNTIFIDRHT